MYTSTCLLLLLISSAVFAQVSPAVGQGTTPALAENAEFEKMKSLEGVWEGIASTGARMVNTFRIIADGSALLHVEQREGRQDIVTIFYPVGKELRADHYCYLKNQPRLVAKASANPSSISFEMRESTNVSATNAAHHAISNWRFIDANHHAQEWLVFENGKQVRSTQMTFTRKK